MTLTTLFGHRLFIAPITLGLIAVEYLFLKLNHAEGYDLRETAASLVIAIGNKIVIEANTSIELKVGGSSIKIEPARITIKSVEIAVQSDANMEIKAGAMMQVKSGAVMTIEGALVKIN